MKRPLIDVSFHFIFHNMEKVKLKFYMLQVNIFSICHVVGDAHGDAVNQRAQAR